MLARTPSSTVYEGWDELISRKVAIKVMSIPDRSDPETHDLLMRFSRGAQAAGILNHPSIVALYDYGETDDSAYLIMELVDGITLKAMLEKQRLPLKDIVSIIDEVAAGLTYSHKQGVVHRDIKPANLLVLPNGRVKITDFGVARIDSSNLTQAGAVIGTPAYMSPEQFLGEAVDWRTDIYSLGVVLYQMLTGHRPYEGSLATIGHKVLYTDPALPSRVAVECPAAFDPVIARAMAKNREERYGSAQEFAYAVQNAAGSDSTVTRAPAPAPPVSAPLAAAVAAKRSRLSEAVPSQERARRAPPSRERTRKGPMTAAIVGAAVGVGIVAFMLWPSAERGQNERAAGAVPPLAAPTPVSATPPATVTPPVTVTPVPPPAAMPAPPAHADLPAAGKAEQANADLRPPSAPLPPPPLPVPSLVEKPAARVSDVVLPASPRSPPAPLPLRPRPIASNAPVVSPVPRPLPLPVVPPAVIPPPDIKPADTKTTADTKTADTKTGDTKAGDVKAPASAERPRVLLYYPRKSDDGLKASNELASRLLYSDFQLAGMRQMSESPPASEIHYFHAEDQDAAARLASLIEDIGREFRVREMPDAAGTHPRGALEVWVAQ